MTTRRLISIRETCAQLNICRATLYNRLRSDQRFPRPVQNGGKVDFFEDEIVAYRDAMPRREYQDADDAA